MSTESAFEAFCEVHALQQKREGVEVPSKTSHSFAYYQWLEVARRRFSEDPAGEKHAENAPKLKRLRAENDAAQPKTSMLGAGSTLADALAQQLTSSLEKQASLSTAPPSLRHASQEEFPMPPAEVGMPAFLTLAEAAVRLTLWHPQDARLALLAARMRPNLRYLEENGVIRTQEGRFPRLQLLMDLLSWRIIAQQWARLRPEMRQVAVDGVKALCTCVRSSAAGELRSEIQNIDISSNSASIPSMRLDNLLRLVSAAIPFEFVACRDLVTLYPEPTGVLCLTGAEQLESALPASTVPDATAGSATSIDTAEPAVGSEDEESEVHVGDLVGAHAPTLSSDNAGAPPTAKVTPEKMGRALPYVEHPVLKVVPRASNRRFAPTKNIAGTRRMSTSSVDGHPVCVSQYHQRYAGASKHASAECHYCATCHLMEIIFRGEKRDCVWKHWPTTRKIQFHLKRFPSVLKLALKRFSEMERGVQLAATDEVRL
ncbi:hypothetical protein ABL78_5265 [Leptomonas seymouri]|uniref:Uncharacterized protein n=1 Tax=Leptomonas seymouri TaxID=5684 RepID=A0A0N1I528_LEPSE|nr:hypothetical protein ABL78_5265 [Leptomonas seymouri]|eukprot:KPI85685.1 hypothetical protein ABL78_5265 [Leptomonas seymouri]